MQRERAIRAEDLLMRNLLLWGGLWWSSFPIDQKKDAACEEGREQEALRPQDA